MSAQVIVIIVVIVVLAIVVVGLNRGHATLYLAALVGWSVISEKTFLNYERCMHFAPCPAVCDCLVVSCRV